MALCTEGFSRFVTSTATPIATGWSDRCRAGFAPTERARLVTAHCQIRCMTMGPEVVRRLPVAPLGSPVGRRTPEFRRHSVPRRAARPRSRGRTVAKVDSIGLVVRRRTRGSAREGDEGAQGLAVLLELLGCLGVFGPIAVDEAREGVRGSAPSGSPPANPPSPCRAATWARH